MEKPIFKNRHNTVHHTKDGKTIWNSRSCAVVAHVIFICNGRYYYLIGKRGPKMDSAGKFNIPCGYFDWDENMRDAMRREVWEETGVDLTRYIYPRNEMDIARVVFTALEQPWRVKTEPDENRQNISLHAGIVVLVDELPKTSLDNMEPGESEGAYWMDVEKGLLNIPQEDWAFNHYFSVRQFIEHVVKI
jgi:8-oxo-dGTP pyrophosphatase MutT (NUDIX family)